MADNSSFFLIYLHHCSDSKLGFLIGIAFNIVKFVLLLPLSIVVLCLGHQRWRQQRSFATASHSDIFTYHASAMELIYALGTSVYFCGEYAGLSKLILIGYYLCCVTPPGQTCFHILTCVERYLAVLHPVTYVGLRQSGGLRIRNISIGCVWLLCFGWIGVIALYFPNIPYIPLFCSLTMSLVIVSFCSLSVLCVLIRPGPGEMAGNRVRVDQSKQRAFNTITAITGVQWLFFIGFLVCLALDNLHVLSNNDECLVLKYGQLLSLPNSFVLPLLFLHRAGKLLYCHSRNE